MAQSKPNDDVRLDRCIEIMQERVPWPEKILMPLGMHIYIVQKGDERIVKCDCGHEFGDWRRNWKLSTLIFVRDTVDKLEEIYPGLRCPDPELCEIREYYCPGCAALLKVESLPVGCPPTFDALPDLDAFYRDWLKCPLPDTKEFKDLTCETTREWGRNLKRGKRQAKKKE